MRTLLCCLLGDIGVGHVGAPGGPAGEASVAGVDADDLAIVGADVDSATLDGGLRANRMPNLVGLRDVPVVGIDFVSSVYGKVLLGA